MRNITFDVDSNDLISVRAFIKRDQIKGNVVEKRDCNAQRLSYVAVDEIYLKQRIPFPLKVCNNTKTRYRPFVTKS